MNKKLITALMAAFLLPLASVAYAQDNGTEFGIEDDLTVLGTQGTQADPDVEIKGFTLFGSSVVSPNIPIEAGNVYINGEVEITSGVYVGGTSTFTAAMFVNDIANFTAGAASIYIGGGSVDQVLKKDLDGSLIWSDILGEVAGSGVADYLPLWKTDQELTVSKIFQTEVAASTHVYVAADLHLSSSVYFGNGVSISTFAENGDLTLASDANIVIKGAGQITLPNAPLVGTDATNKTYVDGLINGAGPWQRNGVEVTLDYIDDEVGVGIAAPLAKLHVSSANALAADYLLIVSSGTDNRLTVQGDGATSITGTLGVSGAASLSSTLDVTGDFNINTNMFQVTGTNGNTSIAGTLGVTGAATLSDNLTVNGNTTLGDAATDWIVAKSSVTVDINGGVVDDTSALTVKGTDSSGEYAAKFYSGANLAAWIKKK